MAVKSEAEAKSKILTLRTEHPDAVHVCYAYLIKKDANEGRSSDDGEPGGTAGKPILNQILSSGLEDVVVAIVRYYGGIKLGTGGLIQAYKTAAKDALLAAETVSVELKEPLHIQFPFSLEGKVNSIIKKHKLEIGSKEFTHACKLKLHIPTSVFQEVESELKMIHGLSIEE